VDVATKQVNDDAKCGSLYALFIVTSWEQKIQMQAMFYCIQCMAKAFVKCKLDRCSNFIEKAASDGQFGYCRDCFDYASACIKCCQCGEETQYRVDPEECTDMRRWNTDIQTKVMLPPFAFATCDTCLQQTKCSECDAVIVGMFYYQFGSNHPKQKHTKFCRECVYKAYHSCIQCGKYYKKEVAEEQFRFGMCRACVRKHCTPIKCSDCMPWENEKLLKMNLSKLLPFKDPMLEKYDQYNVIMERVCVKCFVNNDGYTVEDATNSNICNWANHVASFYEAYYQKSGIVSCHKMVTWKHVTNQSRHISHACCIYKWVILTSYLLPFWTNNMN
jgi:hypothetical protein